MREVTTVPDPPKAGDRRVVSMIAFTPVTIVTGKTVDKRWLERIRVEQELHHEYNASNGQWEYFWKDLRFID